ncbi:MULTISPECIES: transglycosylase domain-containing protein [unclassified Streptomyces]|uniref:transglycosylase domain-containing protein n=1 Tax=unclassified Streptomyces TaxID=2593676 RepID=UPI002DD92EE7|nr:transglycosylase domain-containing protein [Streptomyces sp. NBC_01766]WSC22282.1 transglycosylase domain-containing protein [Streptomyces sp. NBC_01766]
MSDEQPQQPGWTPREPLDGGAPPPDGTSAAPGKKGKKRKRPKRHGWRRLIPTWRMVLGGVVVIVLLLVGGFIAGYNLVDIPPANKAATAQSNVYLYADGTEMARDGEVNRENVPLAQIPLDVQRAALAAEDRDFYSESAVDPQAMIRAAWNTLTGKGTQGGSTITQQYVKNYYLGQEQTLSRKAKEFFIAIKLDREETKDQILEGYLNTSYFGRNAYGIQAAAQAYYGKNIQDIDVAQGAYLASLLNAPSAYDVVAHPENKTRAVARWNYVLDGMVKKKWLSQSDRAAEKFPVPGKIKGASGLSGQRGYLVQAVKEYLTSNKILDEDTLATGGYRITTTIQKPKQDALVTAVDDQVNSKLSKSRTADRNVRVGGASVEPDSGRVVAMYGGIDYTKQYVNNATRRDYQVGSTFKPFVFASAVENRSTTQDGRRITPNTIYDGTDHRMVQGPNGPTGYAPGNEDGRSYGNITVSTATDKSVNAVYAQMAEDVGPAKVEQTATDLGIPKNTPDLNPYPSIALGPSTASVLDMTEAYATLAGHGRHGMYTIVDSISKNGAKVALPANSTVQAVTRQSADTTTSILKSVVESGTGTAATSAGRPAAGKTGTAEDDKAAWFAGYTPDLSTVISVMGQDPDTGVQKPLYGALGLPRVNGGGAPAQIWGQYTAAALKNTRATPFTLDLQAGASQDALPTPASSSASPSGSASPSASASATGPSPTGSGNPSSPPPSVPSETPSESTGVIGGLTGGGTETSGGTNGGGGLTPGNGDGGGTG